MTKEQAKRYFVKNIKKWANIFKIPVEHIGQDNRFWHSARVKNYHRKNYVWYNSKILSEYWDYKNMKHVIFHELGHLKNYISYDRSIKIKIKSEYLAEKFALKMLKKYYPKFYKRRIKELPKRLKMIKETYPKKYQYYYNAFDMLPEYKGTVNV